MEFADPWLCIVLVDNELKKEDCLCILFSGVDSGLIAILFVNLFGSHSDWKSRFVSGPENLHCLFNVQFGIDCFNYLYPCQRKFAQRSERVKSVDLHPTEPWSA